MNLLSGIISVIGTVSIVILRLFSGISVISTVSTVIRV
jgi:hypothetical protein